MKKLTLFLFVFLCAFMVFGLSDNIVEADSQGPTGGQFQFNWTINLPGQDPEDALETSLTVDYGQKITFDAGTQTGYTLLGYQVNGKVELDTQKLIGTGIPVTEDTIVDAFFKLNTETAVIFMDANQDYVEMRYTGIDDKVIYDELTNALPDYAENPKPGLVAQGWTADGINLIDFSEDTFTEDTVVFVKYDVDPSQSQATLSVVNGSLAEGEPVDGIYDFNEVATVVTTEMNGDDYFQYWLKDGIIASLNPIYSFTMIEDVTVEAVFADADNFDSNDLFISISEPYPIRDGYNSLVGQFNLPDGHELIEYGILAADLEGGITFNTPNVVKHRSNKYYPVTNEFMMSFPDSSESPYRAYMITSDGVNTTITYSLATKQGFTEDLFISEYYEGASNDKLIEIFNGTGQDVDLSDYSLKRNTNAYTTWGSEIVLSGILNAGDTFVIANNQSQESLIAIANETSSSIGHNGDDAIGLFKNDSLIDIFGVFSEDPGSAWDVSGGDTEDHAVIRDASVVAPLVDDIDGNDAWDVSEWYAVSNSSHNLGSHEVDFPAASVLPSEVPASIDIVGMSSVNVNEFIVLSETYPVGFEGLEGVFWLSSDEAIATVNFTNGQVDGIAEGSVTIYAYSFFDHDIVATHTVTVLPIQTYDVTFNSNGGSAVATQPINGGESATEPTDPTKPTYEFAGWFDNSELSGETYDFATAVTEDITLYAKWNEIYTITYDLNGGSGNSNPSTYTLDSDTITLTAPTTAPDNKVFDGWYQEFDFSGTEVTEITSGSTGNIQLYANWVDESSVTYSDDLFISEYIEGSGTTRAVEIYNNTGASVDLSNYTITNYYNGNSSVSSSYTYTLSGTLNHGETYVLYHTSSVTAIENAAQTADIYFGSSSGFINFNGDDAIVLAKNGTDLDVIGVIGVDPGSSWPVDGQSTANSTLVRKSTVLNPTTSWDTSEWTAYATDTSDYLGNHTVDSNPE